MLIVGAYDGKIYSNTLYFEKQNNWKGINLEPNEHVFEKLVKNRPNCINIKTAVSEIEEIKNFISVKDGPEMISGLEENYDPRHERRLNHELQRDGGIKKIIKIKTKKLETILEEYEVKKINYLSIDVEGAEFSVIKSIDFNKVFIDVIGFENNFEDATKPIVNYLKSKNYIRLNFSGYDIIMIHQDSIFFNKN